MKNKTKGEGGGLICTSDLLQTTILELATLQNIRYDVPVCSVPC